MSSNISTFRRLAVTIAMAGVAAFGTVAIAPAAHAADVVYDKDGNPVSAPTICTAEDLAEYARKLAEATAQAAVLDSAAAKLRAEADALYAKAAKIPGQAKGIVKQAERADAAAAELEAQARKLIEKASQKTCIEQPTGGGRF
ncbi:hypothetical protein [Blastococcus sp. PRF04-17]|uniref:hypothetical protein n=1 Tax=Blastococcus sp. PRF04-17 TaxID=2933797 RepID=UPI001FF3F9FB|nr:hypothetical protein [Blastococcus sp. PRF04-17]UOY00992.1 hypothetical protein MVA48_18745 [Blastococcus sp. PRF04-17]